MQIRKPDSTFVNFSRTEKPGETATTMALGEEGGSVEPKPKAKANLFEQTLNSTKASQNLNNNKIDANLQPPPETATTMALGEEGGGEGLLF